MNIADFITLFQDIIPYHVDITIGSMGNGEIIYNPKYISCENFRGKAFVIQTSVNGILTNLEIPAEKMSMPINIQAYSPQAQRVMFDNVKSRHTLNSVVRQTNHENTQHHVRLIDENGRQIGYSELHLNPAGDITFQRNYYRNNDGTHHIMTTSNFYLDEQKNIMSDDYIVYEDKNIDYNCQKRLEVSRSNGKVSCIVIQNTSLKNLGIDDIAFSTDETAKESYISRIVGQTPSEINSMRGHTSHISWLIHSAFVGSKNNAFKYDAQSLNSMDESYFVVTSEGDSNHLTQYFPGLYVGHTFVKDGNQSKLIVHTKENDLTYYTIIDVSTFNFFDIDNIIYQKEFEDIVIKAMLENNYTQFVTINNLGEEKVVKYVHHNLHDEKDMNEAFSLFSELYLMPFTTSEPILEKIAVLKLNK